MSKKNLTAILRTLAAAAGLFLLPACQEDLLHLEPMEPADITVPDLIGRMNKATDPKNRYHDC